jgi:hypothetical protein
LTLQEAQLCVRDLTSSQVADCVDKMILLERMGKQKQRVHSNSTEKDISKWPKNLQKINLSSIHIIGQLSQLMEHKILELVLLMCIFWN